jgi:hypothetical protein
MTPKSMPQATQVRLEEDGMAHHHQAQVAHGAAHDLQDIRGGQQPSTRLMAMPASNSINATRRAAPTIRTWPSESEAVTSGNGVLKLLLSQGFFSKRRLPEICENAKHG